jgi:hypothetical protein
MCGCRSRFAERSDVRAPAGLERLSGTFDFRWVRGSTVRVAFQEHGDPAFLQVLIDKVSKAFQAWGVYENAGGGPIHGEPNLAYEIVKGPYYPKGGNVPPFLTTGEASRVTQRMAGASAEMKARLERQAKWFKERAADPKATMAVPTPEQLARLGDKALAYDVLISFAPMPLVIPSNPHLDDAAHALIYAQSTLGSYAKRVGFGCPTTYLGCPRHFSRKTADPARADDDWFNSPEGWYAILHEVGHILGLAHEHQNPKRRLEAEEWIGFDEFNQLLESCGVDLADEEYFERDLTASFPMLPGAERYSQWRDPSAAEVAGEPIKSVMIEPLYWCALRVNAQHCHEKRYSDLEAIYRKLQSPQPADLDQLRLLYPSTETVAKGRNTVAKESDTVPKESNTDAKKVTMGSRQRQNHRKSRETQVPIVVKSRIRPAAPRRARR